MATLKDIARITGVSVPTVSKVLSNKSQKCASAETKNRIWQAVHDLGYTPNTHAKKLASIVNEQTAKNMIAIHVCEDETLFFANYYRALRRKLELTILERNYIPYTCTIGEIMQKNSPLPERQMVGAVVIGEPSPKVISRLTKTISNVVVLSLKDGMVNCDKVFCSFRSAVRQAVSMALKGSKTIYFVGSKESEASKICAEYRREGERFLVQAVQSSCTVGGGYVAGLKIAEDRTESVQIICEGREIAFGIQKAFKTWKLPSETVHIQVLDDLCADIREFMYDTLFIDFADAECVNLTLRLLVDRIQRQHKIPVAYEVSSEWISSETGGI